MSKKLLYDVHERPKTSRLLIFSLQQLLAIIAATITVPAAIGLPTQIPAAIFGAGVGTLIYQLFTKFKSPVFLGSSFAFITPLCGAITYGYCGILLGTVVAGLAYVLLAVLIRFSGTGWVNKLMPPVIVGPVVALIGLSLAPAAMSNIVKANSSQMNGSYNLVALLCGLIAFLTVVICATQKRFTMPKLIPFILGIAAGYVSATIFTVIGTLADIDYLMIIDFSPLIDNFVGADGAFRGIGAFVSLPRFGLVEGIKELLSGGFSSDIIAATGGAATKLSVGAIFEVIMAFLPVALVVFAEHIADHKNLSTIIDKDLIEDPGLSRTLLGDGVGSIAGTFCGVCPNTTYGESVGCVAITGNASVITITLTAFICMVLAFISPLTSLMQTIPSCVMGGVCLTLYGFIAVSGLKMFKDLDLNDNKNLFVVSSILVSGLGGLALNIPYMVSGGVIEKAIPITPIATALVIGVFTNFILNKVEKSSSHRNPKDDK